MSINRLHKNIGNVPTKFEDNKSLGRWVSALRKNYKEYVESGFKSCSIDKIEMDRRIRLLDGINFSWSCSRDDILFEEGEGKKKSDDSMASSNFRIPEARKGKPCIPMDIRKSSMAAHDEKKPPSPLGLSLDKLDDCSEIILSEVKLEDKSVEASHIFDNYQDEISF